MHQGFIFGSTKCTIALETLPKIFDVYLQAKACTKLAKAHCCNLKSSGFESLTINDDGNSVGVGGGNIQMQKLSRPLREPD